MAHPRDLPSVSQLLEKSWSESAAADNGRVLVTALLRRIIAEERSRLLADTEGWQEPDWSVLLTRSLTGHHAAGTVRAINGTGILLHTGLGRAPLADTVVEAVAAECRGATQVEIDPVTGQRSVRDAAVGRQLNALFGGEAALVVNNNAAATLLVLHALSAGHEVVISRGELVEIGGAFRLPEIMVQSQCTLAEVGATNKQRLSDFSEAINDNTGLIMKAHTSNYRITGFTDEVPLEELVALGRKHDIPVVHDIGSGAFRDMTEFGLPHEPLSKDSLEKGADLVFFSGDKLLGGPQCGILLGRADLVEACRNNPLARALRVDKLTLVALQSTLELYREARYDDIPLYGRLGLSPEALKSQADSLAHSVPSPWKTSVQESAGEMGSGSVPGVEIASYEIVLEHPELNAESIASALRSGQVPVYGRIREDRFALNVLALPEEDHETVISALGAVTVS